MQIPYRYYDFNWPPALSEDEYKQLKRAVDLDPDFKFPKDHSFYSKYKWGILCTLLSVLITIGLRIAWQYHVRLPFGGDIYRMLTLSIIASLFCLVALFGLAGGATYLAVLYYGNTFNRRMKIALSGSLNYPEFLANFYRRYYSNRYPFV
jgi:hypothetical protein